MRAPRTCNNKDLQTVALARVTGVKLIKAREIDHPARSRRRKLCIARSRLKGKEYEEEIPNYSKHSGTLCKRLIGRNARSVKQSLCRFFCSERRREGGGRARGNLE